MKRYVFNLVTAMSLSLFSMAAMAQVSHALAEKLVRKSGLWAQMEALPERVQAALLDPALKSVLPEVEVDRMVKIAGQSFAAPRLRKTLVAAVASKMQREQVEQALVWYESPTGELLTALEEAASSAGTEANAVLEEGNRALELSTPERQALITALIRASRSVDAMVDMEIRTAVAVLRGVAMSQKRNPQEAAQGLQTAMDAQRPQMVAFARGQLLALCTLAYATATDRELAAYVQFLNSPAALRMLDVMYGGLELAITQSAQDFGKQIIAKPKQAAL